MKFSLPTFSFAVLLTVASNSITTPVNATPLPYTVETHCFIAYADGHTSDVCGDPKSHASAYIAFSGADGTSTITASVASDAWAGPDFFGDIVAVAASVSNNLSFTGITPGPVRVGVANIVVATDGDRGGDDGGWQAAASFDGISCQGYLCLNRATVPFTLGVPFTFGISSSAGAIFLGFGYGGGGSGWGEVSVSIWDAAGNSVPILPASVPEPSGFVGLLFVGGVSAWQYRRHQIAACIRRHLRKDIRTCRG